MAKQKAHKSTKSLVRIKMIGSVYLADGWSDQHKRSVIVDANNDSAVMRACYGDPRSLTHGKFVADEILSIERLSSE